LEVDPNFGINYINLHFINNTNYVKLNCEPNSTNISKAICVGIFNETGEYNLKYDNMKEINIQI
jgi:hypothetical protein